MALDVDVNDIFRRAVQDGSIEARRYRKDAAVGRESFGSLVRGLTFRFAQYRS
jgi:hypothetical protein